MYPKLIKKIKALQKAAKDENLIGALSNTGVMNKKGEVDTDYKNYCYANLPSLWTAVDQPVLWYDIPHKKVRGKPQRLARSEELRYANWVLHESPWSGWYADKDPKHFIDYGPIIYYRGVVCIMTTAGICGRYLKERPEYVKTWNLMVKAGVDPMQAFVLSHCFTIKRDKYRKITLQFFEHWGDNHTVFEFKESCVSNILSAFYGELNPKRKDTTRTTTKYYGIHEQFGRCEGMGINTVFEDILPLKEEVMQDVWGENVKVKTCSIQVKDTPELALNLITKLKEIVNDEDQEKWEKKTFKKAEKHEPYAKGFDKYNFRDGGFENAMAKAVDALPNGVWDRVGHGHAVPQWDHNQPIADGADREQQPGVRPDVPGARLGGNP